MPPPLVLNVGKKGLGLEGLKNRFFYKLPKKLSLKSPLGPRRVKYNNVYIQKRKIREESKTYAGGGGFPIFPRTNLKHPH